MQSVPMSPHQFRHSATSKREQPTGRFWPLPDSGVGVAISSRLTLKIHSGEAAWSLAARVRIFPLPCNPLASQLERQLVGAPAWPTPCSSMLMSPLCLATSSRQHKDRGAGRRIACSTSQCSLCQRLPTSLDTQRHRSGHSPQVSQMSSCEHSLVSFTWLDALACIEISTSAVCCTRDAEFGRSVSVLSVL